ncbi:MAG: flavodoxin family protein [Candidatus Coatesbacteria bacterium]|nr:flavodoxin family protein [Candidatus Coatesbacteria bacterium]
MRVVILDGFPVDHPAAADLDVLVDELESRGRGVHWLRLTELKLGLCRGCFGCWVKTPGECFIDDDARRVAREYIQSGLAVLATPLSFGGYGSLLKRAVDRLIPLIMPLFKRVRGEVHHVPRYPAYPELLGLGWLPVADRSQERNFTRLIERNAINFWAANRNAVTLYAEESPRERRGKLIRVLNQLEVRR